MPLKYGAFKDTCWMMTN